MPYLFAAALTSSLLGIVIFILVSFVSARFLRHWHESADPPRALGRSASHRRHRAPHRRETVSVSTFIEHHSGGSP